VENPPTSQTWQEWIGQHVGRFLLYARQQTRCEADAEDVLQESLIESWRRCGGEEPPSAAIVFATIRRRAIDCARRSDSRERRERAHSEADPQWFASSPDDAETDFELERAVKDLPKIYQEVVTLKIWGGLTFQEIADSIGVPLNTAASRYRYGLDRLREAFKELPR